MHKLLRGAAITACLLMGAQAAMADVTVTGNYVKFGVNDGGSLIDFGTFTGLQFDPTGTGNFSNGVDFLTPGTPFAFYSLGVNGSFSTAGGGSPANPFSSVTGSYDAGNNTFAITSGGMYRGLEIEQVVSLNLNSNVLHTSVVLTNRSGGSLANIVYGVGLDPDQDYNPHGTYHTANTILAQGSDAAVRAVGPVSGTAITLRNTSGWAATNASIQSPWNVDPYALATQLRDDGFGDHAIALGYQIGPMAAGEQFALGYDYVLTSPIPEPASYLMLMAGMGLLGLAARRRRG